MTIESLNRLNRARRGGAFEKWQRLTDKPMLGVSVAFLVVLVLPMIFSRISIPFRNVLTVVESVLWIVFVIDYLVRVVLAPKRWHFFWTHIPELIVIAVPVLRPLRSLQALRLLRLGGLGTAANRFARRSLQGRTVLLVIAVTGILILTVSGVVLTLERGNPAATITSYPEALWWAISTVTTVGYGDTYPVTTGGRLAALLLMLAGIALVGVITAAVAAWFVRNVVQSEQSNSAELDSSVGSTDASQTNQFASRLDRMEATLQEILTILRSRQSEGAEPDRSATSNGSSD